jgi:hypothetical protein
MGIGGDMGIRNLRINLSPYLFHLLISSFTLIFAYLLIGGKHSNDRKIESNSNC